MDHDTNPHNTKPIKFLSEDEVIAQGDAERDARLARRQWGSWRLRTDTRELVGAGYPIDLETIETSAEMLDWIFQVAEKDWADAKLLGDLILALRDIFDPQSNLCSFGTSRQIDATKFLRARYGKRA